jgi:hypothetical protein
MTPREDEEKKQPQSQPEKKKSQPEGAPKAPARSPFMKEVTPEQQAAAQKFLEENRDMFTSTAAPEEPSKVGAAAAIVALATAAARITAHEPQDTATTSFTIQNVRMVPAPTQSLKMYPAPNTQALEGRAMTEQEWNAIMAPLIGPVTPGQTQGPQTKAEEKRAYLRELTKEVETDLANPKKVAEEVAKEIAEEITKSALAEGMAAVLVLWKAIRKMRSASAEKKDDIRSITAAIYAKTDELLTNDPSLDAERIARQCKCTPAQAKAAKEYWEAMTVKPGEAKSVGGGWGASKSQTAG